MGFLPNNEVITCSVTDFVGEYQGWTGPKVIKQFDKALGKVLFVDEAYRLSAKSGKGSADFLLEAVGEIVDAMTKPRYAGKMVIILAGYTNEMEDLMRANPGLRSRFPTHVTFPPMEPKSCLLLLKQQLGKVGIDIEIKVPDGNKPPNFDDKWKKIYRILAKLSVTRGWASGRDIETLARTMIAHVFIQVARKCWIRPKRHWGSPRALWISRGNVCGAPEISLPPLFYLF